MENLTNYVATFEHYMRNDSALHFEVIRGKIDFVRVPNRKHQEVCAKLFYQFYTHFGERSIKVYFAPTPVRLFVGVEQVDTVVEPDLFIVSDPNKLVDYGCCGTPDVVIEVVSSETKIHDEVVKFALYEQAGIKEYWIVNPATEEVAVYYLTADKYQLISFYNRDDIAQVCSFNNLFIDLGKVFK